MPRFSFPFTVLVAMLFLGMAAVLIMLFASAYRPEYLVISQRDEEKSPAQIATVPPAPSFSPASLPRGEQTYFITHKDNPRITKAVINPFDPAAGETQTMSFDVTENGGSGVSAISVTVETDSGAKTYSLALAEGTSKDGTWRGSWTVEDTHKEVYRAKITVFSNAGKTSAVELTLR